MSGARSSMAGAGFGRAEAIEGRGERIRGSSCNSRTTDERGWGPDKSADGGWITTRMAGLRPPRSRTTSAAHPSRGSLPPFDSAPNLYQISFLAIAKQRLSVDNLALPAAKAARVTFERIPNDARVTPPGRMR